MEDKSHLVTHFMAAGAGKRLEDYHFLRNTYDTILCQEAQLNRILRMLDEDEIHLDWYIDTTPSGRARSRSLYDFERLGDTVVLPGSIAYQRLREKEQDDFKSRPSSNSTYYRYHDSRQTQKISNEPRDQLPSLNLNKDVDNLSTSRLKSAADNDTELVEEDTKRQYQAEKNEKDSSSHQQNDDNDKLGEIELISFTVRYEDIRSPDRKSNDESSLGHLLCEWISPSSSSDIEYYTIERQLGDKEWLSIGKRIDESQNHTALDISSLVSDVDNQACSARFRLKAHLGDGKIFTSKPTDKIFISSIDQTNSITPNVEILSANSVQLTWKKDENDDVNIYDIEKKEAHQTEWEKVKQVRLSQGLVRIDSLADAQECQFRLVPSTLEQPEESDEEVEVDVLTVHNVNEWLSSLRLVPASSNTIDIDISEDGFKEFNRYKVEYTTLDNLDQWKQMPDVTRDTPHLTIDNLEKETDYKFRLTPILDTLATGNELNSSQLSLVLDIKMPSSHKGQLSKEEAKLRSPAPEFAMHQIDATSVLIVAVVPTDKPALFDDAFDIYSKKETSNEDEWTKLGTIDKDHLSLCAKNLEENTAYAFKIQNQTSPSSDEVNNALQKFKFETASVKQYDPNLVLEKFEESLENIVNSVMRAAAGHQVLEVPVNVSLNEVIKEIFHDESLVPSEQYGFDTLALSDDLQLFRGPKQMMLQELEIDETNESLKAYGEIIIHNYRKKQNDKKPVIVREEQGNTRIGNIDGDIIVRNLVTDVLLTNEETRNQLSMNIVGQAFLKGFQGILIASKFKGIIVVKSVKKS